ncbi:MAG: precorrin-2 dehydrogenase/sirohydrochlorin ferrochelatase family protein [Bacillota bacterium]
MSRDPASRSLSLSLRLEGRRAVVIGGGPVAERKVRKLLAAGAAVTVISPAVTPGLAALPVTWLRRPFEPGDTRGALLTVAATGLPEVDGAAAAEAEAEGRLALVAGDGEAGNAALMAELHRGPVTVAVATGGASPALARRIREAIAPVIGPEYGALAHLLGRLRRRLKQQPGLSRADRSHLLRSVALGSALERLARGEAVESLLEEIMKELAAHERQGDPRPAGGAGEA